MCQHWEDLHKQRTSIFQMNHAWVIKSCICKRSVVRVKQKKDVRDRVYKNHWHGFKLHIATHLEEITSQSFGTVSVENIYNYLKRVLILSPVLTTYLHEAKFSWCTSTKTSLQIEYRSRYENQVVFY